MKQTKLIFLLSIFVFLILPCSINAGNLINRVRGKILLQVENNGEAWYVNPTDEKVYYMGSPRDAFYLLRNLGIGIRDKDLEKIPVADNYCPTYSLNCDNSNAYNLNFSKKQSGKIFLQVEQNGEAWYINPANNKRYFLGRPIDAFNIMRNLSLGISNNDLNQLIGKPANNGWLTYTNEKYGFKFNYPEKINNISASIKQTSGKNMYDVDTVYIEGGGFGVDIYKFNKDTSISFVDMKNNNYCAFGSCEKIDDININFEKYEHEFYYSIVDFKIKTENKILFVKRKIADVVYFYVITFNPEASSVYSMYEEIFKTVKFIK